MQYTTVATSKGQLTIPNAVREKLGLKRGVKVDIYPTENGFIGRLHKRSKILRLIGDLKHLDKGESLEEIRKKTQEMAAKEITNTFSAK